MAMLTLSQALDRGQAGEPIAPVCQIQSIDAQGNPTPDSNPAVARVRCKARVEQHHGRAIQSSNKSPHPARLSSRPESPSRVASAEPELRK
jgi:hypothetical protein